MKKGLNILFIAVFLALSIGVTINKHYSAGKLYSISIFGQPESCCDIPCDCCDDESEIYKITGDYLFSSNIIINIDYTVNNIPIRNAVLDKYTFTPNGYHNWQYRHDIHPPRKVNDLLSKMQSYLM